MEVNFFVGCMVSQPDRLFQDLTTMSLTNKISNNMKSKEMLKLLLRKGFQPIVSQVGV